jgi:hypothetical protein
VVWTERYTVSDVALLQRCIRNSPCSTY